MQQAQSGVAVRGGALSEYCADGYADGLCKQSQVPALVVTLYACHTHGTTHGTTHDTRIARRQALASAAELFERHAFDSYEVHVALRTVRTVDLVTLTTLIPTLTLVMTLILTLILTLTITWHQTLTLTFT